MERKEPRMSVWRWDPFDELVTLRESMEHLCEEVYSCRPPLFRDAPVMWETDAALVFRAELPSADPARIEVSLSEDTLTVTAEGLRRTIPLPVTVAPGQARGVQVAVRWGVRALVVKPCHVAAAARLLAGAGVKLVTVVGFPHGSQTTETKVQETWQAVARGVAEVDMVLKLG